jgi:hypothetical protein
VALTPEQIRARDRDRRAASLPPGPEPAVADSVDLYVRADWRAAGDGDVPAWDFNSRRWVPVPVSVAGGGVPSNTADTAEHYRVIMLADGTVKAIPFDTPSPALPTGLGVTITVASVRVAWTPAPPAAQTLVYRDGVERARVSGGSWRDLAVTPGQTYQYTARTVDQYGQRSGLTSPVAAFIDPALNVSPTITITSWPELIPTHGTALVRLNIADADGQTLVVGTPSITSGGGTLTATDDPTVFLYTAP